MATALALLQYEYVSEILERRGPHREAHLAMLGRWHADGRLLLAGATGDPVSGAAFVLSATASPEAFVAEDPYAAAGLIVRWWALPWGVVIGGER